MHIHGFRADTVLPLAHAQDVQSPREGSYCTPHCTADGRYQGLSFAACICSLCGGEHVVDTAVGNIVWACQVEKESAKGVDTLSKELDNRLQETLKDLRKMLYSIVFDESQTCFETQKAQFLRKSMTL